MEIAAEDLREGMYLDLEGDPYAREPCEDGPDCEACERVVASFAIEYQKIESIEVHEKEVRIDCESVSIVCPRRHHFKVSDMTEANFN